jgi:hypothetical protein
MALAIRMGVDGGGHFLRSALSAFSNRIPLVYRKKSASMSF